MTPAALATLNEGLWEHIAGTRTSYGHSRETRRMTNTEWADIQALMDSEDTLIYSMVTACMGFGCGIRIGRMVPSTFPGVPNEVEWLAFITNGHLPTSVSQLREPDELGYKTNIHFGDGWRAFSPRTHSESNTHNLALYKQPSPKSKASYEY